MVNINVVYAYLGVTDSYALRRGDVRVAWSRRPLPDCDLYAYMSAYSFFGRRLGPQVLVHGEPVVTQPKEFTCEVLHHFDYVLSLIESYGDITPRMRKWQAPAYGTGPGPDIAPDFPELSALYPREGRRNAICMINGNKSSPIPGELYSMRAEMARWFYENSDIPFDIYGVPPFDDLPNYVGPLEVGRKRETLGKYRYSLCLENCYDPFWSLGYVTEKLPDSLSCRTVPIYMGCSNIEEYIPTNCFIDCREFESNEQLNEYLQDMTDDDYHAYVDNIDDWLRAGKLHAHCQTHLYNTLTELAADAVGENARHLWGDETQWTPADLPNEPPIRDTDPDGSLGVWNDMNVAPSWTWEYLTRATLDDCAASVETMRKTQTLGFPLGSDLPTRVEKPREVRRLLYLGVAKSHGDHPDQPEYNAHNLLTDWEAWPGVEVQCVDPAALAMQSGVAGMSREILARVLAERYDLVFCVPYARPLDILHDTMREIGRHTNTMVWLTHPPQAFPTHSLPWASCADVVVTTSEADLRAFDEAGHGDRVVKSQWAFSPRTYKRDRMRREPIVTLVAERSDMRAQVCDHLAAHGVRVAIHGRGWANASFLPHDHFLRSFSLSAINLSVGSRRRVYETTGSGGFLMTTPVEGLDDAFVTDVVDHDRAEVVVAHDLDGLLRKVLYYLEHVEEREAIALRGYRRARAEHTWTHRFSDISSKVGWSLPKPPT